MKRPSIIIVNWMCSLINYYSLNYQMCMLHYVHGSSLQSEMDCLLLQILLLWYIVNLAYAIQN
jgi:hypothetical protein